MSLYTTPAKQRLRRLAAELLDILKDPVPGISALPHEGNLFDWSATIEGPPDSPYAGGVFALKIETTEDYPIKPPNVTFVTKVYHPNIDHESGEISLGILGAEWSPVLTIKTVLLSVQSYLTGPDVSTPVMVGIGREYEKEREVFERNAREWTEGFAGRVGEEEEEEDVRVPEGVEVGFEEPQGEEGGGGGGHV